MRQQTAPTTRYYTIPLRSPNGAPPKYVAIPMPLASDQRQVPSFSKPMTQVPPTKTAPTPTPKHNIVQRRARSVPLQEMREAVIDIQANARRGGGRDNHRRDDSSCSISPKTTSDMPADDLHFLKYWEM